jgi:hypothetical protein
VNSKFKGEKKERQAVGKKKKDKKKDIKVVNPSLVQ